MRIPIAWAFIILLSTLKVHAFKRTIALASPDKNLQFQFQLFEGIAIYSIAYKQNIIVDQSAIGLTFTQGSFNDQLKMGKPVRRQGEETYDLVVGKVKSVKERFNEVIIPLEQTENDIRVNFIVRAFNDGIAFRYEFVKIPGHTNFELRQESTSFTIRGNPSCTYHVPWKLHYIA